MAAAADREAAERDTKRMTARLKFAALRQNACVDDIDLCIPAASTAPFLPGLSPATGSLGTTIWQSPAHAPWENRGLPGALGHKASRDGRSVPCQRVPRLFEAMALARGDGRHARMLKSLARVELVILDDWGISVLTQIQRIDLLESLKTATCGPPPS